jgi:hypothetical protein
MAPHCTAAPLRAKAHVLGDHGGRREQVDNVKLTEGGNSADYLARRIARDRPDILARMKAGAFPSARDGVGS